MIEQREREEAIMKAYEKPGCWFEIAEGFVLTLAVWGGLAWIGGVI